MRERVDALVGRATRAMWVTTFHSACARMLRADAERLGYSRSFTIYDESDSLRMLKRCMDELGVDPKRYPPRSIRSQISGAKNQLVDARRLRPGPGQRLRGDGRRRLRALREADARRPTRWTSTTCWCARSTSWSCSDEARERYAAHFRHVLVDEYQDTNHAQYRLLQLLTEEHGNLMVVGDDDQSIYGFRGADIRNILDFEQDFPDAEVVKLEQNYRSTQTILAAANAVVSHNRERRAEAALDRDRRRRADAASPSSPTSTRRPAGSSGRSSGSARRRASSREDVAVFYRTNAQSRVLEDTLVRFELPYQVIGGTKFYERAEIKDAIAYLSLLANPADQVSFAADRQLAAARHRQHQPGPPRIPREHHRAARSGRSPNGSEEVPGLGAAAVKAVARFHETMEGLRGPRETRRRSPSCSRPCWARPATSTRWRPSARSRPRAGPRTSRSWSGSRRVRRQPRAGGRGRASPLEEFLQQISLYTEQDDLRDERVAGHADDPPQRQGPRVRHGLHHRLRGRRLPALALARRGREEEERRLCYVGITRARKRLYLTWARERRLFGRAERNLPSRFLDELPAELTERHSSAPGAAAGLGSGDDARGCDAGRPRPGPGAAHRRRRRPRRLRRRRGHRGRGRWDRRRALRR